MFNPTVFPVRVAHPLRVILRRSQHQDIAGAGNDDIFNHGEHGALHFKHPLFFSVLPVCSVVNFPDIIGSEVEAWRNEVEEPRKRLGATFAGFFDSAALRSE